MARIGLIDADVMWQKKANGRRYGKTKADIFPNLALMKISAWHKSHGDMAEWYNGFDIYDKVYVSKVFSTTPIDHSIIQSQDVIYGGSGFCIKLEDGKETWQEPKNGEAFLQGSFQNLLPYDVEHIMPDYSLYPMVKNTAIGFLSRGCPRGCSFCHVEAKEGRRAYKVADLSEWWGGAEEHHPVRPKHSCLQRLARPSYAACRIKSKSGHQSRHGCQIAD